MFGNRDRALVLSLVLATALTTALPAAAAQSQSAGPQREAAWSWLSNVLFKVGCSLDPRGALCSIAASALGNRCSLDPDGRCAPNVSAVDNGCSLDPNGRCAPHVSTVDNGCSLEPSGLCLN